MKTTRTDRDNCRRQVGHALTGDGFDLSAHYVLALLNDLDEAIAAKEKAEIQSQVDRAQSTHWAKECDALRAKLADAERRLADEWNAAIEAAARANGDLTGRIRILKRHNHVGDLPQGVHTDCPVCNAPAVGDKTEVPK